MIKVSRSLKELAVKVFSLKEQLTDNYGREPTVEEIAKELGVSSEEVAASLEAGAQIEVYLQAIKCHRRRKRSLNGQIRRKERSSGTVIKQAYIGKADERSGRAGKELILRRYFYGQTQTETAKALKVSQVQISRLEKKCLKELRKRFEG